jgi:hypothetical protein
VGSVIAESEDSAASTAVGVDGSSGVLIGSVSGSPAGPLLGSGEVVEADDGVPAGGAGV